MPRRRVINNKEKEIIIISDYLTDGMFGVIITWLTEILFLLYDYNIYPKFIIRSKNYGIEKDDFNIFPSIIDTTYNKFNNKIPALFKKFIIREDINNVYLSLEKIKKYNDSHQEDNYMENFEKINNIFFKFFKLNTDITNNIEENFFKDKKVLGIQLRGTDKTNDKSMNPENISLDKILDYIDIIIKKRNYQYIFVATDSIDYLNKIKHKYKNFNIFSYDFLRFNEDESPYRTLDGRNLWEKRRFTNDTYNIKSGQNAFIDSLTLAKCDMVLFNSSALSSWSKVFNPNLEIYKTNFFPYKFFPYYYIPYFKEFK